jgi:hypothetical protein
MKRHSAFSAVTGASVNFDLIDEHLRKLDRINRIYKMDEALDSANLVSSVCIFGNKKGEALRPRREKISFARLIIRSSFGHDIHATAAFVEIHFAIDEREQCPIATGADVLASNKF